VLGLGYGMGDVKFQATLARAGQALDDATCKRIVQTYRVTYANIPNLWGMCQEFMPVLMSDSPPWRGPKGLQFVKGFVVLPSERKLVYENMDHDDQGNWGYGNGKRLYGALLVENIVQAISRDLLVWMILAIEKYYPVVMHTHDEIVLCVPEEQAAQAEKDLFAVMTAGPPWAKGIPLNAETHIGQRYGDCK
jgi:DNA polymerase